MWWNTLVFLSFFFVAYLAWFKNQRWTCTLYHKAIYSQFLDIDLTWCEKTTTIQTPLYEIHGSQSLLKHGEIPFKDIYLGVSLNGGTPISHPKCWSFLVGKSMVVGETHHIRKPPYCQMMIGVYNHLLSKVFRFHYHSQEVIGSLGNRILRELGVFQKTPQIRKNLHARSKPGVRDPTPRSKRNARGGGKMVIHAGVIRSSS